MIPYRLMTRSDDQLHFVHDGVMPPFNIPPRVIVWGDRVFMLDLTYPKSDRFDYVEVFSWYAVS